MPLSLPVQSLSQLWSIRMFVLKFSLLLSLPPSPFSLCLLLLLSLPLPLLLLALSQDLFCNLGVCFTAHILLTHLHPLCFGGTFLLVILAIILDLLPPSPLLPLLAL